MDGSRYKIKKKRKFKKSFLIFLIIIFILVIAFLAYKTVNLNNFKNYFQKKDKSEIVNERQNKNILDLFILRLVSQNLEFASSSIIEENGDQKIYIKDTKNDSGYIYVNTKDDPEFVWNTFASAILADPIKSKLEKELLNLEYIDLRFGNKVFFKFKDKNVNVVKETFEQNDTTSSTTIQNNPQN